MGNILRERFGITEGKNIDLGQFELVMDSLNKKEISQYEVMEILKNIPNIVEVQKAYIDFMKDIVNAIKETQKSAFEKLSDIDEINNLINTLNQMLCADISESFKEKILEKVIKLSEMVIDYKRERDKTIESMNKENNSFWTKVVSTVGVIVVALFAYNKNKNT